MYSTFIDKLHNIRALKERYVICKEIVKYYIAIFIQVKNYAVNLYFNWFKISLTSCNCNVGKVTYK
jgi:hypothetical protein